MHSTYLLLVASLYVLPGTGAGETAILNAPQRACCQGNCQEYRGKLNVTKTGRACQRWDVNTPHKVAYSPAKYPDSGLIENFCRNPSGHPTLWCYTTDPSKYYRWEECDSSCDSFDTLTEEILKPQTISGHSWVLKLINITKELKKQVGQQQKNIESLQKELNETQITQTTHENNLIEMEHLLNEEIENGSRSIRTEIKDVDDALKILIQNRTTALLQQIEAIDSSIQKDINSKTGHLLEMINNGDESLRGTIADQNADFVNKMENEDQKMKTELRQMMDRKNDVVESKLIQIIDSGDEQIKNDLNQNIKSGIQSAESKLTNKINAKAEELSDTVSQQREEIEKMIKDGDNAAKNSVLSTMDNALKQYGVTRCESNWSYLFRDRGVIVQFTKPFTMVPNMIAALTRHSQGGGIHMYVKDLTESSFRLEVNTDKMPSYSEMQCNWMACGH